jgi:hypothetical protein
MTTTTHQVTVGELIPTESAAYWHAIERPAVKRAQAAASRPPSHFGAETPVRCAIEVRI